MTRRIAKTRRMLAAGIVTLACHGTTMPAAEPAAAETPAPRPASAATVDELAALPGVRFIAPWGTPQNPGTLDAPWDIVSALGGAQRSEPDGTLYVLPGTYRIAELAGAGEAGLVVTVAGKSAEQPLHISAVPGHRATIDGSVTVSAPSTYIWMHGLEITASATAGWDRKSAAGGGPLPGTRLPDGGLTIHAGEHSKYINLVVHHAGSTGVSFWRHAIDSELHGCLIYSNGSIGPDRYHGPGIYTQNETGEKWITDNLIFANYSTTIQAYGSKNAWVDHFRIIGNICFDPLKEGRRQRLLVGGGRPSHGIVVRENICHDVPIQVGYNAPENEDCVVRDNIIVRGGLAFAAFKTVENENNLIWNEGQARPEAAAVFVRPNRYDPDRANLAIINWPGAASVDVDVAGFLADGESFRLLDPYDVFGAPVRTGQVEDGRIAVPLTGEFAAFVLVRVRPDVEALWNAVVARAEQARPAPIPEPLPEAMPEPAPAANGQ